MKHMGACWAKLLEWLFVFQVQYVSSVYVCAVALCFRSGIGTIESGVRSSYAHQCYINMSKDCRSGQKLPWIHICRCADLNICENLDLMHP